MNGTVPQAICNVPANAVLANLGAATGQAQTPTLGVFFAAMMALLPVSDPGVAGEWYINPSTFSPTQSQGSAPYTPSWDFSDSRNSQYVIFL